MLERAGLVEHNLQAVVLSVAITLPKEATFRLVEQLQGGQRTGRVGVVAVAQFGAGVFVLRERQLFRYPRPVAEFSIDADGRGRREGFHHGHPGGAVFAAASPAVRAECMPKVPVRDRYGGARGVGGGHLQNVDRRYRHQGAHSAGAARKHLNCGSARAGEVTVSSCPQILPLHQDHNIVRHGIFRGRHPTPGRANWGSISTRWPEMERELMQFLEAVG